MAKKIYFVRHGEAAGNATGFTQKADTPLTEEGHRQAAKVAERFRHVPVEVVFASYMDRAQDTARYIADVKGKQVETIEYFHEWMKPTSVQGAAHTSDVYKNYLAEEDACYSDPEWRYEDGENFADILDRVSAGISYLESRPEEHIVVVSHGRLLRFLVSYLLHQKQLTAVTEAQTKYSLAASNTGITHYVCEGTTWKLISWNDIAHFAE